MSAHSRRDVDIDVTFPKVTTPSILWGKVRFAIDLKKVNEVKLPEGR